MEQIGANSAIATQVAVAQKMITLQNQMKGGVGWFFWIAGVSVLNTVIILTGASFTFVIGLAATQFVDILAALLIKRVTPAAGNIVRVGEFGLDLILVGIFLVCGYLGRKQIRWVIILGMVLYALDGILSFALGDWIGIIFHFLALAGLWNGFKAINGIALLEKTQSTADLETLRKLIAEPSVNDEQTVKRRRRILALLLAILLTPLFFYLIWLVLYH
jgi:hypothetical protein